MIQVSISEANYEFTVRFYEFHNPLGLQCGECEIGGPPACCDDVEQTENCRPNCDTKYKFILRPFRATIHNGKVPYYLVNINSLSDGNGENFTEAPSGLYGLPNPFTITNTSEWTVS